MALKEKSQVFAIKKHWSIWIKIRRSVLKDLKMQRIPDGEYVGGCIAGGRSYCHINANGEWGITTISHSTRNESKY